MKMVAKDKVIKVGMTDHIQREISVMKMVKHPNIVELHEVLVSRSKIFSLWSSLEAASCFLKLRKSGCERMLLGVTSSSSSPPLGEQVIRCGIDGFNFGFLHFFQQNFEFFKIFD
ncbi:hypothetical protein LXL04_003375 [Taraxacum kok-saghyz]